MRKLKPLSELRRSTAYSAAQKRMGQAEELAKGGSEGTADVALAQARKFAAYTKGGRQGYRQEADKQSTKAMVRPDREHPRPLMWKRGAIRTGTGEGPVRTADQPGPAGAQIKRSLKSIQDEEEKANEARVLKPKKKEKDTNPTTRNLPEPSKKDKFTNPFVPSNEGKMSDLDIKAQEGDKKAKRKLIKISFDAGTDPDTPKKKLSEVTDIGAERRRLRGPTHPRFALRKQMGAERRDWQDFLSKKSAARPDPFDKELRTKFAAARVAGGEDPGEVGAGFKRQEEEEAQQRGLAPWLRNRPQARANVSPTPGVRGHTGVKGPGSIGHGTRAIGDPDIADPRDRLSALKAQHRKQVVAPAERGRSAAESEYERFKGAKVFGIPVGGEAETTVQGPKGPIKTTAKNEPLVRHSLSGEEGPPPGQFRGAAEIARDEAGAGVESARSAQHRKFIDTRRAEGARQRAAQAGQGRGFGSFSGRARSLSRVK